MYAHIRTYVRPAPICWCAFDTSSAAFGGVNMFVSSPPGAIGAGGGTGTRRELDGCRDGDDGGESGLVPRRESHPTTALERLVHFGRATPP